MSFNIGDCIHFNVRIRNNLCLRYQASYLDLIQSGIEQAWKSQLKEPHKYNTITPQRLLSPLIFNSKYKSLIAYLNKRYW